MLCSGVFLWARITEGGLVLLAGKPPEHQLDHADLHLRLARRGLPLVIPAVDPTTTQPGKCPLHHPTPLDHSEALAPGGATLDLDRVPAVLGDPSVQLMVVVLVVRPELLQPRERLLRQLPEHLRGRGPVIRRGAGDGHRQKQPERVHHDVPLATVEPLAAVVTVGAADLGSPDRLAVDAAGAGSRLPPRLAGLTHQPGTSGGCRKERPASVLQPDWLGIEPLLYHRSSGYTRRGRVWHKM